MDPLPRVDKVLLPGEVRVCIEIFTMAGDGYEIHVLVLRTI